MGRLERLSSSRASPSIGRIGVRQRKACRQLRRRTWGPRRRPPRRSGYRSFADGSRVLATFGTADRQVVSVSRLPSQPDVLVGTKGGSHDSS
jgi:hypothetical protein